MRLASSKHFSLIKDGGIKYLDYIIRCPYCGQKLLGVYDSDTDNRCQFCNGSFIIYKKSGIYKSRKRK